MPGMTAGGLPYPLPSEPVRDGAAAIRDLAEAIEARGGGREVRAFRVLITPDGGGTFAQLFPGGSFKAGTVPNVTVTCESSASGIVVLVGLQSLDANGFSGAAMQTSIGASAVRGSPFWAQVIAVGQKP